MTGANQTRSFPPSAVHLVRTVLQSNMTLSQMADQKANMMMGAAFVVFTLAVGQARGVCLLTLARAGLPVAEYATRLIKKAVVGTGAAEKTQVQAMLKVLLPGVKLAGADAADALAVAITHAHMVR